MHKEFENNFQLFKENLDSREDTNFNYLQCRLDFNMYYQMKIIQDMGEDDAGDDIDDYGDENDDIGYGQENQDDDDGEGNDYGNNDDDDDEDIGTGND